MEKTHRIMLIHLRIFCELTSACFNADALQVRYRISSRCTKLLVPLTRCVRLRRTVDSSCARRVSVNRGGAAHAARDDKLSRPSQGEREREREKRIRGA